MVPVPGIGVALSIGTEVMQGPHLPLCEQVSMLDNDVETLNRLNAPSPSFQTLREAPESSSHSSRFRLRPRAVWGSWLLAVGPHKALWVTRVQPGPGRQRTVTPARRVTKA